MTDQEFANRLAKNINPYIDIPVATEAMEEDWLTLALTPVVGFVPAKYRDVMLSVSDGIDDSEIAIAKEWLLNIIDDKLPIPFFTREFKSMLLDQIVEQITKYLKPGVALSA